VPTQKFAGTTADGGRWTADLESRRSCSIDYRLISGIPENLCIGTYLLGYENARNYDGSWTEWGNLVAAPIEKGEAKAAPTS
jgi:hypothetical protein